MTLRTLWPYIALGFVLIVLAFLAGARWAGTRAASATAGTGQVAPMSESSPAAILLAQAASPMPTATTLVQPMATGASSTATDAPPTATPTAPPPSATRTPRPPTPTRVATATPVYVLLEDREALWAYVTPTYTPSPTPTAIPPVLLEKIAFRSNLMGSKTKGKVLLVDPDGRNLALLVDPWAYEAVCELERLSPDGRYRVDQARGQRGLDLWLASVAGGVRAQLTFVGKGQAYDASWFPDGRRIAFASNQEGDDDIFVVTLGDPAAPQPQTINLTPGDTWESDKHPSVSPDGQFIVFYSNRTGRNQIWIMSADGTNPRQLVALDGDCWDPIWFKPCYTHP